jgi:hypothetical protein
MPAEDIEPPEEDYVIESGWDEYYYIVERLEQDEENFSMRVRRAMAFARRKNQMPEMRPHK